MTDTMQPPEGSIGMMQIDCEILDTQLLHVRKSAFPPEQSDYHNFANHTSDTHHAKFSTGEPSQSRSQDIQQDRNIRNNENYYRRTDNSTNSTQRQNPRRHR